MHVKSRVNVLSNSKTIALLLESVSVEISAPSIVSVPVALPVPGTGRKAHWITNISILNMYRN